MTPLSAEMRVSAASEHPGTGSGEIDVRAAIPARVAGGEIGRGIIAGRGTHRNAQMRGKLK